MGISLATSRSDKPRYTSKQKLKLHLFDLLRICCPISCTNILCIDEWRRQWSIHNDSASVDSQFTNIYTFIRRSRKRKKEKIKHRHCTYNLENIKIKNKNYKHKLRNLAEIICLTTKIELDMDMPQLAQNFSHSLLLQKIPTMLRKAKLLEHNIVLINLTTDK